MKNFIGQTLRIYTITGLESYLGSVEDVKEAYVVLTIFFSKHITYLAIQHVESFKEEEKND